jgi:hypothetical protein
MTGALKGQLGEDSVLPLVVGVFSQCLWSDESLLILIHLEVERHKKTQRIHAEKRHEAEQRIHAEKIHRETRHGKKDTEKKSTFRKALRNPTSVSFPQCLLLPYKRTSNLILVLKCLLFSA